MFHGCDRNMRLIPNIVITPPTPPPGIRRDGHPKRTTSVPQLENADVASQKFSNRTSPSQIEDCLLSEGDYPQICSSPNFLGVVSSQFASKGISSKASFLQPQDWLPKGESSEQTSNLTVEFIVGNLIVETKWDSKPRKNVTRYDTKGCLLPHHNIHGNLSHVPFELDYRLYSAEKCAQFLDHIYFVDRPFCDPPLTTAVFHIEIPKSRFLRCLQVPNFTITKPDQSITVRDVLEQLGVVLHKLIPEKTYRDIASQKCSFTQSCDQTILNAPVRLSSILYGNTVFKNMESMRGGGFVIYLRNARNLALRRVEPKDEWAFVNYYVADDGCISTDNDANSMVADDGGYDPDCSSSEESDDYVIGEVEKRHTQQEQDQKDNRGWVWEPEYCISM